MCRLILRLKNKVRFVIFSKYALDDEKCVQRQKSNAGDQSKADWIESDEDLISGINLNRLRFELDFGKKTKL